MSVFQDTRKNIIILVMLTVQTQASSLFKKVMSESNLYKLKGGCYFVSVIHTLL